MMTIIVAHILLIKILEMSTTNVNRYIYEHEQSVSVVWCWWCSNGCLQEQCIVRCLYWAVGMENSVAVRVTEWPTTQTSPEVTTNVVNNNADKKILIIWINKIIKSRSKSKCLIAHLCVITSVGYDYESHPPDRHSLLYNILNLYIAVIVRIEHHFFIKVL